MCFGLSYSPLLPLTWGFKSITLEILAAQTFIQVRAQAHALSIQQSESASVMTGLALAHVILRDIVCRGPLQVGYRGAGSWHFKWN